MGWLDRFRSSSEVRQAARAERAADVAQQAAEQADSSAEQATVAAEQAEQAAESSAESAERVDNATDLVAESPVPPATTGRGFRPPSLLRHSAFSIGFTGALGALVALFLSQQLLSISSILTLLVLSLFLAIGLNPLVEWFMRRGARRGVAVFVVLTMVLTLFALFVVAVVPVISDQVALITENAPRWIRELQANSLVQRIDERFDVFTKVEEYVSNGDFGEQAFGGAVGVGLAVLSALANSVIVLVLMIYFLSSLPSIKHAGYSLAPASRRPRVSELGDKIIRSTGAYVAGAFVVAVCAGLTTLVFTFFVGLGDYSFALAFIVGLLSLIPVVGSVISAVLITALGLTVSPTIAIICLAYYLAYQQLEAYVIYPRIMARSVEVPGAVTVIAALVGGGLMGVIGAVLAVPTAAALLLLHREVFLTRQDAR
ncbi:AI-2E family transporter [Nocardioides euryhalodurans]|uniref:AI-2E family transporter n=1 Tax=Nocardioides euryhalodurans TaxID=2518370 RepID=A0A4P7GIM2_9ACTN|nr:AI-2E family transporter [Nocardioides euryhalodurans]QBR91693.1 AI-2E family transporter [Nocardioides euryhalodurans]